MLAKNVRLVLIFAQAAHLPIQRRIERMAEHLHLFLNPERAVLIGTEWPAS
jgi:hypothetical protein